MILGPGICRQIRLWRGHAAAAAIMLVWVASASARQPQSSPSGTIPASSVAPVAAPAAISSPSPGAAAPAARAQASAPATRLDAIAMMLDAIGDDFRNASREDALADLRARLLPLSNELRDLTVELEPRARQI